MNNANGVASRVAKVLITGGMAAALLSGLAGCGQYNMTCDEFAQKSDDGKLAAAMQLMKSHHLSSENPLAYAKIEADIATYCGISVPETNKATEHESESIDNAIDWSKYENN